MPFQGVDSAQVEAVLADLSQAEKIGQLLLWQPDFQDSVQRTVLFRMAKDGKIGGMFLEDLVLYDYLNATDSLGRCARLPLFYGTRQRVSLHNQFAGFAKFPLPATVAAVDSARLDRALEVQFLRQCKALGINFAIGPSLNRNGPATQSFDFQDFEGDEEAVLERSFRVENMLRKHRVLAVGAALDSLVFEPNDSLRALFYNHFIAHGRAGLGGLLVRQKVFRQDTLRAIRSNFVKQYLRSYLRFNGLMVVEQPPGDQSLEPLMQGAHQIVTHDAPGMFAAIDSLLKTGGITSKELDERVRLVLRAKAWVNGGKLPMHLTVMPVDSMRQPVKFVSISEKTPPRMMPLPKPRPANFEARAEELACYFEDPGWRFFIENIFTKSVVLVRDDKKFIPFQAIYDADLQVFEYGRKPFRVFDEYVHKYADASRVAMPGHASGELGALPDSSRFGPASTVVVLLDSIELQPGFHKPFLESLARLAQRFPVVVVNFGSPKNMAYLDPNVACLQVFERNYVTESQAAQALFGGVSAVGKLPLAITPDLPFGTQVRNPSIRLGFAASEATGIANERLVSINAIAETAIDHGVFPGCQVVIAKDGQVIYSQAFGTNTYGKKSAAVVTSDLYDIASVTKVAATTLAAMKLVETGQLDLNATVGDYLRLPAGSKLGGIKLKNLLLHQSGLQAQMPLSRFFSGKNVPAKGCNDYFCRKRKGSYSVKVSDGLYFKRNFQDTIWNRVYRLPLAAKPRFRYSDVNFFLLQKIIEARTGTRLSSYVFEQVYRPLGLRNISYLPLERFPRHRLVPTEQDNYWRKTLVHGTVHDPAVALMGGVGGSAGVFSNAEDLAVLLQLLLNGGHYGGVQFFDAATVGDFTYNKYTNHRGLGFDMPANRRYPTYSPHASAKSFGHTGFTGTCVWADPENKLVYVFLSNRVNPSARNGKIFTEAVRSRIHEVVYDAMGSYVQKLPVLEVEGVEEEIEEDANGESAGGG